MATVGLFEAKTHLSALVDRVGKGESIVITRHGQPAARLVPVGASEAFDGAAWLARSRALRKGARLQSMSIRELVESGPCDDQLRRAGRRIGVPLYR